jgi:hypothetical protein
MAASCDVLLGNPIPWSLLLYVARHPIHTPEIGNATESKLDFLQNHAKLPNKIPQLGRR